GAMPWFVEGLAVFASGQLGREYQAQIRELVVTGYAPARLAEIWQGAWRYGVAGSLVAYIDRLAGRERLASLLTATSEGQVLAAAGVGEAELLAGWRASVLAAAGAAATGSGLGGLLV